MQLHVQIDLSPVTYYTLQQITNISRFLPHSVGFLQVEMVVWILEF